MTRFILILISFIFFYSCDNKRTNNNLVKSPYSLENKEYVPMPQLKLSEESFDFGDILQGVSVSHIFTVKNVGDDDLIILTAKGSCGCTVPEWYSDWISPGETGEIKVTFNSGDRIGKQKKTVTLQTNAIPNIKVLTITANIINN
jgi:hypothetical protein